MKLAHAFANLLLLLAPASARPEADEDNTTPSLRATSNRKLNDSLLAAHDVTPIDHQGRVLLTNDHRALGGQKIDISDIAKAQSGGKAVLESLSSSKETFVPKEGSSLKHMRFTQSFQGMEVEGAALMVHTDDEGNVIGVNGEHVDTSKLPLTPSIGAAPAIQAALAESVSSAIVGRELSLLFLYLVILRCTIHKLTLLASFLLQRVPPSEHDKCTQPKMTVVRGLNDGLAHLSWTCTVRYDVEGEDGYLKPFKDQIFAKATGEAGLIQIHPKIYGGLSMRTDDCAQSTRRCTTISTSTIDINTGDLAVDSAHNFAIATYKYYSKFGRDSVSLKHIMCCYSHYIICMLICVFLYLPFCRSTITA